MQSGARLQAAIEVLTEIMERGRAASVVLADWGRAHRFAGSGDRAWIGNLVFDSLRRKQSLSYVMRSETARSIALAALRNDWNVSVQDIASFCSGEGFCPAPSHIRGGERPRKWRPGRCSSLDTRRLPRMASSLILRGFRRSRRRGRAGFGLPRSRGFARQHAEGDARKSSQGLRPP